LKSISKNVLFYFIALWIFIYIISTTIAGIFPHEVPGYFRIGPWINPAWILVILTQFIFARTLDKREFDRFYLLSLYLSGALWILFSTFGVESLSLVLSMAFLFLSWQVYRVFRPVYGKLRKHFRDMSIGSLLFSWSIIVLLSSLAMFWRSELTAIFFLFLMVLISSILAHTKIDPINGLVFSYFAFSTGIENLSQSYYVAVAGISSGIIFLLIFLFAIMIAREDPSKKIFAAVNPPREEEIKLKINR
jgi:MFS family permease